MVISVKRVYDPFIRTTKISLKCVERKNFRTQTTNGGVSFFCCSTRTKNSWGEFFHLKVSLDGDKTRPICVYVSASIPFLFYIIQLSLRILRMLRWKLRPVVARREEEKGRQMYSAEQQLKKDRKLIWRHFDLATTVSHKLLRAQFIDVIGTLRLKQM